MKFRTAVFLAFCLLWVALQPSPTTRNEVRSMSVGQPQLWDSLAPAVDSQTWWYATLPETTTTTVTPLRRSGTVSAAVYGSGACGGDLPPCSVLACESGGNLTAQNRHSTASGKWQILDTSWRTNDSDGDGVKDNYQGYSRAMDAPENVQDDRAREIWNGGRGAGQWVCK